LALATANRAQVVAGLATANKAQEAHVLEPAAEVGRAVEVPSGGLEQEGETTSADRALRIRNGGEVDFLIFLLALGSESCLQINAIFHSFTLYKLRMVTKIKL
jgi:hypothetical protein